MYREICSSPREHTISHSCPARCVQYVARVPQRPLRRTHLKHTQTTDTSLPSFASSVQNDGRANQRADERAGRVKIVDALSYQRSLLLSIIEISIHTKGGRTEHEVQRNESRWWREGHKGNRWELRRGGEWMSRQKRRAIYRKYIRSHWR